MANPSENSSTSQEVPQHYSSNAKELWHQYVERFLQIPSRLQLFKLALEAFTRAENASETLKREGMYHTNAKTGVMRLHPAYKVATESAEQFSKISDKLGILLWQNYPLPKSELRFDDINSVCAGVPTLDELFPQPLTNSTLKTNS